MLLIVREEVLQYFIDTFLLPDYDPHCPFELNVIFFIFLHFFLGLGRIDVEIGSLAQYCVWDFCEVLLVKLGSVKYPESAVVRLEKQSKDHLLV